MTDDRRLREEMLKANGISAHGISNADREALQRLLRQDKARARRMKWATLAAWGMVLAILLIGFAVEAFDLGDAYGVGVATLAVLARGALTLAVICTVFFAVREYLCQTRAFKAQITEMNARLAGVEKAVKRLAEKE